MKTHVLFPAFVVILLAGTIPSRAATKTWDGSSSANWATLANWTNNAVPVAGDDVIFPAGAANKATLNNIVALVSLRSITFTDSGYTLSGNALTLTGTNGISANQASGSNAVVLVTTLATNATVNCATAGASLGIIGNLTNGGFALTANGSGLINFTNRIVGAGTFTKLGTGTNRFAGVAGVGNLYSGETLVSAGVLELRKTGTGQAIPGNLTINAGATVRFFQANQIASAADITVGGNDSVSGLLDLNGQNNIISTLVLTAGVVNTAAGILELSGDVTASAVGGISPRNSSISGNLLITGGNRTFNVANNLVANPDLAISAVINGAGGLIKTGAGQLELSGVNTYSGLTTVTAGSLTVATPPALGSTSSGTLLNGGSLVIDGLTVTGESLTNNSASSVLSAGGVSNAWTGSIVLNADLNLVVVTNRTLSLSGRIDGTGGLVKSQPGVVLLSGNQVNVFTGTTTVTDGQLHLNRNPGQALLGGLVIGDGAGGNNSALVLALTNNQVFDGAAVTLNTDGQLNLNGFSEAIGLLTMTGGQIQTLAGGLLTLGGNVTINDSGGSSFISGRMTFGGATRTFLVAPAANLAANAQIISTGGFIKTGEGDMILQGSNTFTGTVTVSGGLLRLLHPHGLGAASSGTTVNGTGTLQLESNIQVLGESLLLDGPGGAAGHLTITGANPTNLWSGNLTLNTNGVVTVTATSGQLTFSNVISGAGGFTKAGSGIVQFKGGSANSYAGTTTVNGGTLLLSKPNPFNAVAGPLVIGVGAGSGVVQLAAFDQIADASAVTVNSGGLFDVNGMTEAIGPLAGSGNVALGASGGAFTIGNNTSTLFSGVISGGRGITKQGGGTLTLTGTNTYTGATTVVFGKLIVNGSQPQSAVSISPLGAAATLGGSGVVGSIANNGNGTVSPGASPGTLTSSNLLFSLGSTFSVELNGTTPGTDYDQLNVRGTNNLTTCNLSVALNFASALSNQFVIINNDGADAITGAFSGRPEGTVFPVGAEQFRITYAGGSGGNDVVLTQVTQNAANRPVLTILAAGTNSVRLQWPASFLDFFVQTNSDLTTTNWNFTTQPVLDGANQVVTNVITDPQMFFRLIQD